MNYDIAIILSIFPLIMVIVAMLSPSKDKKKRSVSGKKPVDAKTKKLTDD